MNSDRLQVLLIDDDDVERSAVRATLADQNVALVEATSSSAAFQLLADHHFDCVLLDCFLPDVHASPIVPHLLTHEPTTAIVVLTGFGDEDIAIDLMKAGIRDAFSRSSLDPLRLAASIRAAVAQTQARAIAAELTALRRRHTERLEALMAHAHELVGSVDMQTLANRAKDIAVLVLGATSVCVHLHGIDGIREACVGEPMPINEPSTSSPFTPVADGGRPFRIQDGGGTTLSMWLSPLDDGSRSALIARVPTAEASELTLVEVLFSQLGVLLMRSIENNRLLRTAEKAMQARDDVIAVVSHDLRGPLGSALVACSLLAESAADDEAEIVSRMQKSLKHMQRLVDDLVFVVRAQRGDIPLKKADVDPAVLLAQALAIVVDSADLAGVTVAVQAGGSVFEGDAHRLLQVLANLVGNAVKFTPRGGRVDVSSCDEGDQIRFRVVDTGAGIAESDQVRIFDRFYSADRQDRGLGLCLAISQGVVRAHGGRIGVQSTPGHGSRFTFTLPRHGRLDEFASSTAPQEQPAERFVPEASGFQSWAWKPSRSIDDPPA
jgi:signal transduction histidine kinase/DNA-binding NarL/FixJ family response regulator